MDALLSKGNSIAPLKSSKRPPNRKPKVFEKDGASPRIDPTLVSISSSTRLPSTSASKAKGNRQVKDLKLRSHLNRLAEHATLAKTLVEDAELLMTGEKGRMQAEGGIEKTWRVEQDEIIQSVGVEAATQRREWKLDGGSYRARYSRNGRHLAVAGKTGHVASFDWQIGTLHAELQLRETTRDITFLHDQSHFAVAQKQHVFIYDQSGIELHRLASHVDVNRLEYLPWHWLLASVGNAGYLKYTDTSTGTLIAEQRTKLGSCNAMAQNLHNAVIYLGHQNGTVTLRTPNLPTPPVTLLAHMGPVSSISVDPSSGGRYMASGGTDGRVKVWDCRNWKGCVREWSPKSLSGNVEVEWSQKGFLAVASGGSVNIYTPPTIRTEHGGNPPVYMTHSIPHRPLTSVRFCPFSDILTIGHAAGLSSILVPGAGEPNFDSAEADPFEGRKMRREREVRGLLDKVQPDLITLSDEFAGTLAPQVSTVQEDATKMAVPSYTRLSRLDRLKVSGKADDSEAQAEDEDDEATPDESQGNERRTKKEKMKQRGKGKSLNRYLRKKRKNVIDPSTVAIRKKIQVEKEARRVERAGVNGDAEEARMPSALDRFRSSRN